MVRRLLLLSLLVAIIAAWLGCAKSESDQFLSNLGLEFVFVKGGTFEMGDTFGDGSHDEKPVHKVTLSDFYMSKYEVTYDQYDVFCDSTGRKKPDDWDFGRGDNPVTDVSWDDAKAFCDWVSSKTGYEVRLPTEAEWEYAARGGSKSKGFKYSGSNDAEKVAWYEENSDKKPHQVGKKKRNELGLYDMSGNVQEWCSDAYDEDYYRNSPSSNPKGSSFYGERVLRGGAWGVSPRYLRCADRVGFYSNSWGNHIGFRCVREL